jgi:hypothetical protein
VNQKWYSQPKQGVNVIESSQPKGVKFKMEDRKLRSGVNLQESLKQKGVKQTGVKQGMSVYLFVCVSSVLFLLLQKQT